MGNFKFRTYFKDCLESPVGCDGGSRASGASAAGQLFGGLVVDAYVQLGQALAEAVPRNIADTAFHAWALKAVRSGLSLGVGGSGAAGWGLGGWNRWHEGKSQFGKDLAISEVGLRCGV